MKPKVVVSTFNGMSFGRIALEMAGIPIKQYFSYEIDKYANQVAQAIYPDTIQLGDVRKASFFGLPKVDILLGGSPCQGFSFAGKQLNFDDPRSKLFFEFVRLKEEMKPKYFLLENVMMKQESQDVITKYLGVGPIKINSSLLSAQNRKRLYWTNIPGVKQPKDMELYLKHIFEGGEGITERYLKKPPGTSTFKNSRKNTKTLNDKSNCLTFSGQNISNASCTNISIGDKFFKLTPKECGKLQTVPEDILEVILNCGVSNSQLYKIFGNGWTASVIAHIFKNIK